MPQPNFMLLYVDSPQASARFYGGLLAREPVESSATFVLFTLESGLALGLWARHLVKPAPVAGPGGAEIVFPVDDAVAVSAVYRDWKTHGVAIAQEPTEMDFGTTFVGLIPTATGCGCLLRLCGRNAGCRDIGLVSRPPSMCGAGAAAASCSSGTARPRH